MPNTGQGGTRNDLGATLPQVQDAEAALYEYATGTLGIDYRIADFGALRTLADTQLIMQYRQNDYNAAIAANPDTAKVPINKWRPISPFGSSYHNYGAAFDVLITDAGPYASAGAALEALKAAAPSFGLSSSVPNDPPHFELAVGLGDAQQLWADYMGGGGSVNVRIGGTADTAALFTVAILGAILFAMRYFRR
jgi:hypothetical protein